MRINRIGFKGEATFIPNYFLNPPLHRGPAPDHLHPVPLVVNVGGIMTPNEFNTLYLKILWTS